MKKLVLTFALLLTVSFAFATNEAEKTSTFDVEETLEITTNSLELAKTDYVEGDIAIVYCCTASSGGVSVTVCQSSGACAEAGRILDLIME